MLPLGSCWGNQRPRPSQLMLTVHHLMEREDKKGKGEGRGSSLFWEFLLFRSCVHWYIPSLFYIKKIACIACVMSIWG